MSAAGRATGKSKPDFNLQPDPRILPMLGEINLAQWKCLAELIDNSVDGLMDMGLGPGAKPPEVQIQIPLRDSPQAVVSVVDNGPGMSAEVLERAVSAGWSGNQPHGKLGLFGMGFNIATARLGKVTTVWTSRKGDKEKVGLRIDFDQLRQQRSFRTPRLTQPKNDPEQHGTEIVISDLKPEQRQWFSRPANRSKIITELSKSYAAMLRPGGVPLHFKLTVNGAAVQGKRHCVWSGPGATPRTVMTPRGPVDAFQPIDSQLEDRRYCTACWQWLGVEEQTCPSCLSADNLVNRKRAIKGWIGIQRYLHESDYGIDFLRHGRKIEIANKELFYWQGVDGELNELEYPIDDPRNRGRIVGEIHLDHCRVSYTKDRFDRTDPAWDDMRSLVRGHGPLRPDKASEIGISANESPLYRLFQIFRRSSPKSKVAGAWKKLLVVPDNDQAREMGEKFHEGAPGFEHDTKWWELVEEADRALLTGTPTSPTVVATGQSAGSVKIPAQPLAGFGAANTAAAPAAAPPIQKPLPSLTRNYLHDSTGQRWSVQAYQVEADHPALSESRPWALQFRAGGSHEFFVSVKHQVFKSATMTPARPARSREDSK